MIVSGTLTKAEIDGLLERSYIARLGCYENGKVYIVPVTYSYDPKSSCLIGVSGEGQKLRMLRSNPRVCVEIEKIEDLSNWKTVIAWGEFEEMKGADAKVLAHDFVRNVSGQAKADLPGQGKFLKDISSADTTSSGIVVYRIHLKEKSGRFERS